VLQKERKGKEKGKGKEKKGRKPINTSRKNMLDVFPEKTKFLLIVMPRYSAGVNQDSYTDV